MYLAVRAPIRPSRLLRLLLAGYALACVGAAGAMLAWSDFHFATPGALACLLAGLVAARAVLVREMTRGIDISGPGEIRLTVQHGMGDTGRPTGLVKLLPGSTIWPHCMLLRLGELHGTASTTLVLLPDSMPADVFRNVSIALRAIARRDN